MSTTTYVHKTYVVYSLEVLHLTGRDRQIDLEFILEFKNDF